MKKILFLYLALVSCTQSYSKSNDYYCFSNKNTVLLIPSDYPNTQYVKYYPYLKNIKISKPIKVIEEDMGDNAKPEIYSTVNEIVNGEISGQYTFMSQGYLLYEVTYKSLKSKKITQFNKTTLENKDIHCL